MSDDTGEHSEVYNYYLELSKPTEEDFKRVFTDDELKELCLKRKCKVDMSRWNVVHEYRILFTESGRYQKWSERHRRGMLAKAVNKMKPSVLYDEEEIKKIRREEWEFQLKENILSLNFWQRQRLCHPQLESADIDEEMPSQAQCLVNTESMNVDELLTQSEKRDLQQESSEKQEAVYLEVEILTEASKGAKHLPQLSRQEAQLCLTQGNLEMFNECERLKEHAEKKSTSNNSKEKENDFFGTRNSSFSLDDSADSIETVLNNEYAKIVRETLQSEEVGPEIENIYAVDTLSMTIDSRISTVWNASPMPLSEEVIPASYDQFRDIIPMTSTQSTQSQSEEL